MKQVYIITNNGKDEHHKVTRQAASYLESRGVQCILDGEETKEMDVDCAVVIGGDGTLSLAARELLQREVPILGVNMGTVSYTHLDVYKRQSLCKAFAFPGFGAGGRGGAKHCGGNPSA